MTHFYFSPSKLEFSIEKLDDLAVLRRDLLLLVALDEADDEEIIEEVLVGILAAKDVDLIVHDLRRVAIPPRGHVALLLALEPLQHFELPSPPLQIKHIADVAIFIVLDLALRLVEFLM